MPIGQTEVKSKMDRGVVGRKSEVGDHYIEDNFPNYEPEQIQKDAIQVDTASADTTYSYVVDSETVEITTGSSPSVDSIVQDLVDEHNANPMIRGQVKAKTDKANDKVRLEGIEAGLTYDVSTSDSNLTLNPLSDDSQDAQDADPVGFGLAVLSDGQLADASLLTKKSVKLTHAETASASVKLKIDDVVMEFSGATAGDLVTNINNNAPPDTVTASEPNAGEVLIEVATAGDNFELVDADESELSIAGGTRGDRIAEELGGVTRHTYAEEDAKAYEYPAEHGIIAIQRGPLFVKNGDNASKGDPAFLSMTGDDQGQFYTSRGTGRVKVPESVARWKGPNEINVNLF